MTFEGQQIQGVEKIAEKLAVSIVLVSPFNIYEYIIEKLSTTKKKSSFFQSLTFQKINRGITAIDCQPTFEGGVIINVLGRLKVRKLSVLF